MKNLIALLLLGFIGSVQCLNSVDGSNKIKHLGVTNGKDGEDSRELNEDEHGRAWDLVFGKGPENMAFYKTKLGGKKTNNRNAKNKRKRKGSCPKCRRNHGNGNNKPAQQARKKTNKKPKNRPSTPPKKTSKKRPVNRAASKPKPVSSGTKNNNKENAKEKKPSKKKGLNMSGRGVTGRNNNGKKSNKNTREGSVRGSKV